jgi:hypothetical protein
VKHGILVLALIALTGCASTRSWIDRHPIATTVIVTSLLITAKVIAEEAAERDNNPEMITPRVDCATRPESCR